MFWNVESAFGTFWMFWNVESVYPCRKDSIFYSMVIFIGINMRLSDRTDRKKANQWAIDKSNHLEIWRRRKIKPSFKKIALALALSSCMWLLRKTSGRDSCLECLMHRRSRRVTSADTSGSLAARLPLEAFFQCGWGIWDDVEEFPHSNQGNSVKVVDPACRTDARTTWSTVHRDRFERPKLIRPLDETVTIVKPGIRCCEKNVAIAVLGSDPWTE